MSMIIIMKSNRVNLFLLFMFASKDHSFCKKVQLKQVRAEAGHRCLARGFWCLFTPTEGGGRNHKHYFSWHARLHSLLHIPDVRFQDPGCVRADNTLVHSQIFWSHQTIQKLGALVPKSFPGWQGSLWERNTGYRKLKLLKCHRELVLTTFLCHKVGIFTLYTWKARVSTKNS